MIEVLVALGIFVTSMVAAFQLFFGGQSLLSDSANIGIATDYSKEALDALRSIRNRNWSELTEGAHGLVFNGSEWLISSSTLDAKDIFTRQITIGKGDSDNEKIATTTITWQADGRDQILTFVEKFTHWELPSQSSCKTEGLSGNWSLPVNVGSGDLGAGNEGTDVVVKWPYAYVSGVASADKHDIFVFDVSNPILPNKVASLNIGAGGINALFLRGNYLYAASPNTTKELIIFNISDPVNISEVGSYDLTGGTDAISVYVFGDTAVVGREDSASNEIAFLNIANPASPSIIREDQSSGGDVNDFAATGEYLYAISEESDEDIWIYNISNTANPVRIGNYDIEGETEDLSVFMHFKGGTSNLLVGNEENELVEIGATTTDQMYVRDRLNVGGSVNDIVCVLGDLAFLATTNSGKEFFVASVANPDNIVEYSYINYPQYATGIDFANNYVFMSVRSNDALRIITSSP